MDAAYATAQALIDQAPSNVDALLELFAHAELPGAAPLERARWVLKLTASDLPGMHMGAFPADDSGFKAALADERFYEDPRYWAKFLPEAERQSKQMGHFLTAVGLRLSPLFWRLLPVHIEMLLTGWIVQLAMGVAFWILPRFQSSRGDVRPAWAAFALLSAGLLLVVAGTLAGAPGWTALAGRLAEMAAVAAFALNAWPRVKPIGV